MYMPDCTYFVLFQMEGAHTNGARGCEGDSWGCEGSPPVSIIIYDKWHAFLCTIILHVVI